MLTKEVGVVAGKSKAKWTKEVVDDIKKCMKKNGTLEIEPIRSQVGCTDTAFKTYVRKLCRENHYDSTWTETTVSFKKNKVKAYAKGKETKRYVCMSEVDGEVHPMHVRAVDEKHARMIMKHEFGHLKIVDVMIIEDYETFNGYRSKNSSQEMIY